MNLLELLSLNQMRMRHQPGVGLAMRLLDSRTPSPAA
jgi:hypothetical protein